jgi:hypothetical protein
MKKDKFPMALFLLIMALAFLLRFYRWSNCPFGYDQVQILINASKIKNGSLTLIGPQTGPASLFGGPMIYYITAMLMFLIPPPYTVVATSLTISLITGIVIYFLTKKYLSRHRSEIFFVLWVFSPFIISQNRIPWTPSLSFLAASLVFLPLLNGVKNRLSTKDILIVAIGIFLGYQSHVYDLFLFLVVFLASFLFFKPRKKLLLASTLAFCFSLLPTLIFDLRHQWLNLRGLITFLTDKTSVNLQILTSTILKNLYITIENLGRILFFPNSILLIAFSGALFFIFSIALLKTAEKRERSKILFSLFWIFAITVFFSPYRGITPEYYFLIQFPPLLYLSTNLIQIILPTNFKRTIALTIFACYSLIFVKIQYGKFPGDLNLDNQVKAANYLYELSKTTPIKKLNYDMDLVYAPGFQYLLNNLELQSQGQEVVITYPFYGGLVTAKFPPIGLWLAPPVEPDKNYLKMADYLISTPKDIFLYQDYYRQNLLESSQTFIISQRQQNLGTLLIYPPQTTNQFLADIAAQKNISPTLPSPWNHLTIKSSTGFAYLCNYRLFLLLPLESQEKLKQLDLIKYLKIISVSDQICKN